MQDENVRKSKSSTGSQGTQEEEGKLYASELVKARDTQIKSAEDEVPWKTSRVFRNSKTKEVQAGSRKAVSSACLPVTRSATFIIKPSRKKPEKREESPELPQDVLNIEMEEGLYEFSREVHTYLSQMERISRIPSSYLDQDAITGNMRAVLVDWLTQVQHHLKLSEETLFRTVIILDTVLWQRSVDPDKLQLVGITAMLLASKLEEYYPVEIPKLIHLTENSYRRRHVLEMERTILVVLGFKVSLKVLVKIYIIKSLYFSVHHAEPAGLPPALHPGGPEVWRGGVLPDLHLPPGLSPGGEGPLLPPGFSSSSGRCPGSLDALQSSSEELPLHGDRPSHLHHLHHLDTDPGPLHGLHGQ